VIRVHNVAMSSWGGAIVDEVEGMSNSDFASDLDASSVGVLLSWESSKLGLLGGLGEWSCLSAAELGESDAATTHCC
jgi:hypothetical protein